MGNLENCCKSDANVDNKNQVETLNPITGDLRDMKFTRNQIVSVVKFQALIRGFLTRKRHRLARIRRDYHAGHDPTAYGQDVQHVEYENPRVFVSTK